MKWQAVWLGAIARTMEDLNNAAGFSDYVEKTLRNAGYVRQETPVPIRNARSSRTIGYKTVAATANTKCFVAQAGYRFGKPTTYVNDYGNPDTILRVLYCQPADNFPDFEALVSRIAITESNDVATIRLTARRERGTSSARCAADCRRMGRLCQPGGGDDRARAGEGRRHDPHDSAE